MLRVLPLVPICVLLSGEQALVLLAPLPVLLAGMVAGRGWRAEGLPA